MNKKSLKKIGTTQRKQLPLERVKEAVMRSKALTIVSAVLTNYYVLMLMKLFPKKYSNSARTLTPINIIEEISKSKTEFNNYLKYGNLDAKKLKGKTVLEIGTGANHLVPLYFIANGAKRVLTIDKFYCLRNDADLYLLYKKLYSTLSPEQKRNFDRAIHFKENDFEIDKKYLEYRQVEIGKLSEREKFDINISHTVFEHIYDVDEAIGKLGKVIRKNGQMLALVDINDHGLFSKYHGDLYYLHINKWLWNRMTNHIGRVNRNHMNVYETTLKKYGFKSKIYVARIRLQPKVLTTFVENPQKGKEYTSEIGRINADKPNFYKTFRDMDERNLIAEGFFINATKK